MISNLERGDLEALLTTLARFEVIAEAYLPGTPVAERSRLRLLIFNTRGEFRKLFDTANFAGFMMPSLTTNTLVIAPHRGNEPPLQTMLHEYSHYLLRNRLDVNLPLWFDEGMANLLASTTFGENEATLGALPAQRMRDLTSGDTRGTRLPLTLRQAMSADYLLDWRRERIAAFYGWSWLVTHYLMLGQAGTQPHAELFSYLADRESSLPEHLGISHRGLERRLHRYVRGRYPRVTQPIPEVQRMALEVRCLSDLERDLALSRSMLEFNPKRVLKLLEPHRDKQPDDVRLLVIASRAEAQLTNIESAELLAERAYTLAPDDVDTTVNMADQLVRNCLVVSSEDCHARWRRAIPLYRNALKLDRQRYDAVFGLGLSYLYSGHPGDAVNYFRVAYSKTPWAININFFLGESYRAIGDSRARIYLTNARNWAQSEFWRAVTEAALARLESS